MYTTIKEELTLSEIISNKSGQISVEQVLELYSKLGIPHFQRGLVWSNDSISSLLESLYYGTPCGSFVFWKPLKPFENGILLPSSTKLDYLILDGQQRIRSLASVFLDTKEGDVISQTEEDLNSDDNESYNDNTIWCVNLTQIPELRDKGYFEEIEKDRAIFRLLRNIWINSNNNNQTANIAYKNNHIPLNLLLNENIEEIEWDYIKTKEDKFNNDVKDYVNKKLRADIKAIKTQKFFFVIKDETENENKISDMIKLYNRINSGGKKVEAEEKSFATLISLYSKTNEHIDNLFKEIHKDLNLKDDKLNRDDVLSRKKERNFGFKLFIRLFIQVCNYHFGFSSGSSSLSFDVINSNSFKKHFSDSNKEKVEKLWKITADIVKYTHNLITNNLKCDSLQFLPETNSLLPVFQLLIQYPNLMEERYSSVMQTICLKLLLAEKNSRDILNIVTRIRDNKNVAKDSIDFINNEIKTEKLKNRLSVRFESANSLQDRYILLLYWLERKNMIRDLSYKNVSKEKRENLISKIQEEINNQSMGYNQALTINEESMPFIDESLNPEKQHIVPYSVLKQIYDLKDKARLSSHISNNIGNITYISHLLNSFEFGLGDEFIDLRFENDSQLKTHFFKANDDNKIVNKFNAIRKKAGDYEQIKKEKEELKKLFENFCRLRRKNIIDGFIKWIEELENKNIEIDRFESVTPLFVDTKFLPLIQRIRLFNYDNRIEDLLIKIIDKNLKEKKKKNQKTNDECLTLENKKEKKISLHICSDKIVVEIFNKNLSVEKNEELNIVLDKEKEKSIFKIYNSKPAKELDIKILESINKLLKPENEVIN